MATVITGNKTLGGTTSGVWNQGLDAYSLAVRYGNFKGTLPEWLESLKATPMTLVGEPVITDDGVDLTIGDANGEYTIHLRNGIDMDVVSVETNEEESIVTLTTGTEMHIPRGPQGADGREVILRNVDNVLYWRYATDDPEWKQVADLMQIMVNVYNTHPPFIYVDELPDPANAIEGVEYRLRQNGGD